MDKLHRLLVPVRLVLILLPYNQCCRQRAGGIDKLGTVSAYRVQRVETILAAIERGQPDDALPLGGTPPSSGFVEVAFGVEADNRATEPCKQVGYEHADAFA